MPPQHPEPASVPSAAEVAREAVAGYLNLFPDEARRLDPLIELLNGGGEVWSRKHPPGHLTASAVVVDPSTADGGPFVLLVHHVGLGRWLQPGGHTEAGETTEQAARREAEEEVGLADLVLHPWHAAHGGLPIDIDIHPIPANPRKGEPAHLHHDFRYLYVLAGDRPQVRLQAEEVGHYRWEPFDGPHIPDGLDLALAKARRAIGGT